MVSDIPTILATSGGITFGTRTRWSAGALTRHAVELAGVEGRAPRVCYVGTASGDAAGGVITSPPVLGVWAVVGSSSEQALSSIAAAGSPRPRIPACFISVRRFIRVFSIVSDMGAVHSSSCRRGPASVATS